MSYLLKPNIFEFFGAHAKVQDTFKDGNDKGIWERYQESCGEAYDIEVQPLLDIMLDNTIVPETLLAKLIPTVERVLGSPPLILEDVSLPVLTETLRRKFIRFAHRIYNIKSTELSYQVLINLLGIDDVTIDSFVIVAGFDSDTTFDDPVRLFDDMQTCNQCRAYNVVTNGLVTLTPNMIAGLARIIKFLEPINAELRDFTYNGIRIELSIIMIFIQDGKLFYDNANDTGITLSLIDGKLYKDGFNSASYTFNDQDGKLYLITS